MHILASILPVALIRREDTREKEKTAYEEITDGAERGHCSGWERSRLQRPTRSTLQLKWVTQAQFAGYYVAKDKGFYKEAGLDVTIKPGGPDIAPPQVIAGGGADVIVDWMPSALASREKGVPLVNIAQPFKRSGMMLTCRNDTGIKTPADFKGKTLGVWFFGNEYPFLSWMSQLGIPTTRRRRWRQGAEAGLQRRSAAAEAGRLHLDHDLQRILAGDRRRHRSRRTSSSSNMRTRASRLSRTVSMSLRSELEGPGIRRCHGALRQGLDEGLGLGARQSGRGRQDRARQRRHRRPDREAPEAA